jgi:hypothetical protein
MEKARNQAHRVRLSLLALATAVAVGALPVLSTPVQTVNAQSLSEFALLIQSQCGGEPEIKDDKIECPSGIELKDVDGDGDFDKFEAPSLQCEIKEDKNECPEEEEE